MRRGGTVGLIAVAVLAGTGCAAIRAAQARNNYFASQLNNYTYAVAPDQVMPYLRQLLFQAGYVTRAETPDSIETEPVVKSDSIYENTTRYLAQAFPAGPGGTRVQITVFRESYAYSTKVRSVSSDRDWMMELSLLERFSPQEAFAMRAEADRQGALAANAQ